MNENKLLSSSLVDAMNEQHPRPLIRAFDDWDAADWLKRLARELGHINYDKFA